MKKELNLPPLLPFTSDEESALAEKINAMTPAALAHYVESAQLALRNTALDPSWRPRVEFGLKQAEAAALREAMAPPIVATPPQAPVAPPAKAKKVAA